MPPAAVGEGAAEVEREAGDAAGARGAGRDRGAEHGAEGAGAVGDRQRQRVGGRHRPPAEDVEEDRRAAVEAAVEGDDSSARGVWRLFFEPDLGREDAGADLSRAAGCQRLLGGRRLQLRDVADREAGGIDAAGRGDGERQPPQPRQRRPVGAADPGVDREVDRRPRRLARQLPRRQPTAEPDPDPFRLHRFGLARRRPRDERKQHQTTDRPHSPPHRTEATRARPGCG